MLTEIHSADLPLDLNRRVLAVENVYHMGELGVLHNQAGLVFVIFL